MLDQPPSGKVVEKVAQRYTAALLVAYTTNI